MFRFLGKMAVGAATMAFLTAVSLLLLGSFLMTWPIMRKSPREAKIKATVDMATASLQAIQIFGARKVAELTTDTDK